MKQRPLTFDFPENHRLNSTKWYSCDILIACIVGII